MLDHDDLTKSLLPKALLDEAKQLLGIDHVLEDLQSCQVYGRDWSKCLGEAAAVVRPADALQLSALLQLCQRYQVPFFASGGRTGLSGGAVATQKELVISLERLSFLGEIDPLGRCVTVGAGVVTGQLHRYVEEAGWLWPIDFAAKDSSHIGGNIATNAGGIKVLRYGSTRQWVLGLQVVLPQGQILDLNHSLEKNNIGMDLKQCFMGSEGILGIITAATLKLVRKPRHYHLLYLSIDHFFESLELLKALQQTSFVLSAYEVIDRSSLQRVQRLLKKIPVPLTARSYSVLVEIEEAEEEALLALLEKQPLLRKYADDLLLLEDHRAMQKIWHMREHLSVALADQGSPYKFDVALPLRSLVSFEQALRKLCRSWPLEHELCLFGHIGDGNLHINITQPIETAKQLEQAKTTQYTDFVNSMRPYALQIYELVQSYQGSLSAEHGIGLLKKEYLKKFLPLENLQAMQKLKQCWDPLNLLNPGKVIDIAK